VRLAEPKVPNLPTGSHANPLRASSIDEQKMLENAVEEAGGNWTVVDHEVSPTSPVSKTQIEGPLSQRIAMVSHVVQSSTSHLCYWEHSVSCHYCLLLEQLRHSLP
jgi:hypothetical protein